MSTQRLGILGGTFDPIHYGHLTIADQLMTVFQLDTIDFIPCGQPVHRSQPCASAQDRLMMLNIALTPYPHWQSNRCEIDREGPSYAIDTVTELQRRHPNHQLYWIMGDDAMLHFNHWHRWDTLVSLCHLVIVHRQHPIHTVMHCLEQWGLTDRLCLTPTAMQNTSRGGIYLHHCPSIDISATAIREATLLKQPNKLGEWVPEAVLHYIQSRQLYHHH